MSIYTFIRLKQNQEKARLEAEQQKKEASKPKKKPTDKKKATE